MDWSKREDSQAAGWRMDGWMAEARRVPSNAIAEEEHGPYDDATGALPWLIRNLRPPMVTGDRKSVV